MHTAWLPFLLPCPDLAGVASDPPQEVLEKGILKASCSSLKVASR